MISLTILDRDCPLSRGFEVSINPNCIMLIKDGGVNEIGLNFVHVIFSSEVMKSLPHRTSPYVAVVGTHREVLQAVEGGAK